MAKFKFFAAMLCAALLTFVFVACSNDDVDTGHKALSIQSTPEEKVGNQVLKNSILHNWDQDMEDDHASDDMTAKKTVYTVVEGEVVNQYDMDRTPKLEASMSLAQENYNITEEQVDCEVKDSELKRSYALNNQGIWEEKDTLVAQISDGQIVNVPVKISTEEIEVGGKVFPFGSDSLISAELVAIENVPANMTRAAAKTYISAVYTTTYKALLHVQEKNVDTPQNFEVPLQIATNRYVISLDDVASAEVINKDQKPIDNTTSEVFADVVLTMKSGEVINEHLSYIVNHQFTKRYGGKKYVSNLNYEFALNPLYTSGTPGMVKTDGNWTINGQTDVYKTDDSNGVDDDLVMMYTDLYREGAVYHHAVVGDIVWEIQPVEVSQISTGITAVASDEAGWQKAELTDVISAVYLGRGQSLDAKADLYTKNKTRTDFDLMNGELKVVDTHIKGKIDVVETFSDGSTTTTTDNIDIEWFVQPISDWKAYESKIAQTTGAAVVKLVSSTEQTKGFWSYVQENREITSEATLLSSVQKNIWQSAVANKFKYTREGKTYTFDEIKFEANNTNGAYVTLAGKEDGLDAYTYVDKLSVTFGGVNVISEAPGKIYITNAAITGYSAKDKLLTVTDNNVTASFTKVTKFSDNTEKEDKMSKTYPRNMVLLTSWQSHETSETQTTAQPTIKLESSEPESSDDGWSCVNETRFINTVVKLAGSTQNNSWRSVDPNSIKYSVDGFSVDFGTLNFTAALVNSGAVLKASTPLLDTYAYSGTIAVSFGSNMKSSTAPGTIYVDKEKVVTGHEIRNAKLVIHRNDVTGEVTYVTLFNDGSEESVPDQVVLPRDVKVLSNWLATSAMFPFMTGAASVTLTSSANKTNGYWSYVNQTRRIKTVAQLDGTTSRDNEWETIDPNKLVYTRDGVSYAFDEIEFDASYVNASTTLKEETATSATYDYTCTISIVYGTDIQTSAAPGTITLAKEKTVTDKKVVNPEMQVTDNNVSVKLTWVVSYSDGSEESEQISELFDRNWLRKSNWASVEANAQQTTGPASVVLEKTEALNKGFFSYNNETRTVTTEAKLNASTQKNLWQSVDPNHIVFSRDGVTHDFGTLSFAATETGASTTVTSESETATIYGYTDNVQVVYGGNTKNGSAPGQITVNKPQKQLKWGKITGTAATVSRAETVQDWKYTLIARTEKGVIKFIVPKEGADIVLDESMFEANTASNINSAAYYQGAWIACEAQNASKMMLWTAADGSKTYSAITYTDARQIGWQHGINSVFTNDYSLSAESNGSVLKITRNSDGKTWLINMPTVQ